MHQVMLLRRNWPSLTLEVTSKEFVPLDALKSASNFPGFCAPTEIPGSPVAISMRAGWAEGRNNPRGPERAHQTVLSRERRQEPAEASREGSADSLFTQIQDYYFWVSRWALYLHRCSGKWRFGSSAARDRRSVSLRKTSRISWGSPSSLWTGCMTSRRRESSWVWPGPQWVSVQARFTHFQIRLWIV